jgi:hypothetical protein
LQVGDTGPVESARRSNSRVLGSPFSGLSGQAARNVHLFVIYYFILKHFKYKKGFLVFVQKELSQFLEHSAT